MPLSELQTFSISAWGNNMKKILLALIFLCQITYAGALKTGNASTSTALAANGTNCAAGNYPLGVDASGNAESCTLGGTHITATAVLDFPNSPLTGCDDLTMTVTGAADGDICSVGVPNGSAGAESNFTCWVSAANTATVRHCTHNLVEDVASGTFRVMVVKF